MADKIPIRYEPTGPGLSEFQSGDSVGVQFGGTGGNTATDARVNLGAVSQVEFDNHNHDSQYLSITPSIINGQPHFVFTDTTRGKVLTLGTTPYTWAMNSLGNNAWMSIGRARDSDTSHIAAFDGTICGITIHCENTLGNTKNFSIYVNGTAQTTQTLSSGTNSILNVQNLSIDLNQSDRIRVRVGGGGTIQDTVVSLLVRWRYTP